MGMAKLYFRYGAMGSSKTANAIMVKYNYWERGKNAILIKPSIDTRNGSRRIWSRCGLEDTCISMEELDMNKVKAGVYDCLIVDEAQFLTKDQVELLVKIQRPAGRQGRHHEGRRTGGFGRERQVHRTLPQALQSR